MGAFAVILRLKDKSLILNRLYRDYVRHVEEISLIEEGYLWQNVSVYVDDNQLAENFLILRSFLQSSEKHIGAYMVANAQPNIQGFSDILRRKRDCHTHLQTSAELEPYVMKSMGWLSNSYEVRYCRADSTTFKPCHSDEKGIVLLTPDTIKRLKSSNISHLTKRAETASIYGLVNEKGEVVASSGIGFLTKKSFSISYVETSLEYRNRGLAKCLTSLASEPLIMKGLVGVYCADSKNEPSLRVAKALGFLPYMDLMCFFN
jgi:hypothetical protein